MPKHSLIGASSAYRWFACPGSVRLASKAPPQEQSVYAREGTAAHQLADTCIRKKLTPDEFLGEVITVDDSAFEVNEEMAESVQLYLDTIERFAGKEPFIRCNEIKFDLETLYPGLFGTCDFALIKSDMKELIIIDFKYGRGQFVPVEHNKQLLYYALGALVHAFRKKWIDDPTLFGWEQIEKVRIVICQPRYRAEDRVREWIVPRGILNAFADELCDKAARTKDPKAQLVAGDHCRWCPAKAICPALTEQITELAIKDFKDSDEPDLPAPESMTKQQIVKLLGLSDLISSWLKSIEAYAHHLAEQGEEVPGFKLVKKRANRKWVDEASAADELGLYLGDDEIWTQKLKSPAQIEKLLGAKKKGLIQNLFFVPDTGTTLVPEYDKKEAVKPSIESDFSKIET